MEASQVSSFTLAKDVAFGPQNISQPPLHFVTDVSVALMSSNTLPKAATVLLTLTHEPCQTERPVPPTWVWDLIRPVLGLSAGHSQNDTPLLWCFHRLYHQGNLRRHPVRTRALVLTTNHETADPASPTEEGGCATTEMNGRSAGAFIFRTQPHE